METRPYGTTCVSAPPPRYAVALIAIGAALVSWSPASSQRPVDSPRRSEVVDGREAAAGEVIAKFRNGPPAQALALIDAGVEHPLPTGAHLIRSRSKSTADLVAILSRRPDAVYVEPNYLVRATAVSNDPMLPNEWFLNNPHTPYADISAHEAWDVTTGSAAYVVGLVDSGIDHDHPDLVGNLWRAPSAYRLNYRGGILECPAGSPGLDALAGNCGVFDSNGHGTRMSGVIGAVGNNGTGVSGINWRTSIMDLRFLGADGQGWTSDAIVAIDAALQLKNIFGAAANVRVLSNSWMAPGDSQALRDAVARTTSADVLFVAAAGNDSRNADVSPRYPAAYPIPNVVSVAATTEADELAWFSNFGASTVHLGAPGINMLTTAPNNSYAWTGGTSGATAAVSGVAALVLSACPLNTAQLKDTILQTVDPVAALSGRTITGGRVNAAAALRQCAGGNQAPTVTITSPAAQTRFVAPATITITADASDVDGGVTKVEFYANGAPLGSVSTPPYSFSWTNVAAGSYTLSAIATDNRGRTGSSAVIDRIFVDPPHTPVPSPWIATDIGATGVTGSSSYANGVFTVRGAGADVWGTADAFQYVYQPLSGDGAIVARVASVQYVAAWTKVGVMIRNTLSPSSAHAFMLVSAGKGIAFQRRGVDGGTSVHTSGGPGVAPQWVRLSRAGQTITAAFSPDGTTWTTIGQETFAMAATVYVGLAVSSHDATQPAQATFDSVLVNVAPTSTLPAGWDHRDIGAVGPAGSAVESGGTFTLTGAGADIWNSADAFHYAYLRFTGDVAIVARVASVEYVAAWTKAGVMIRETLSPSSAHAMMLVSPGRGVAFQRRTSTGGLSTHTSGGAGVAPKWVKLARSGHTIAASISSDGATWTEVGRDTFSMSAEVYVGLAVTSHDATRTATATFDQVAAARTGPLPEGWVASDVGSVGVAGSARESAGTFTVSGAGADIWGTADAFHYVYTLLSGNGSIVARVDSVEYVAPWTKVGVMIRETLSPSSAQAIMLVSAGRGLRFQRRTATEGLSTSTHGGDGVAPQWVKLTRTNQTIAASTSTDGVTWTEVGRDTFSMAAEVYVGLAVSSNDTTRTATATFSNVTRTPF
jgi:regulation of enolase protein 1 (concanavalin A-like superfamily)